MHPAGSAVGRIVRSPFISLALVISGLAVGLAGCGQSGGGTPINPTGEGSIAVLANTFGASIFLDGDATGLVAPDTLNGVAAGSHQVTVARAGFTGGSTPIEVTVTDGSVAAASFQSLTTSAPVGSIGVTADVPGGRIYLDNQPTGLIAPDTLTMVELGLRQVSVRLLGFNALPAEFPVTVTDGVQSDADFSHLQIAATDHTVLLEHFTNWYCVPCTYSEPKLDSLYHELDRSQVVLIAYHENIASRDDPFYLANPDESLGRLHYYQVTASPWVSLNGGLFTVGWGTPDAYNALRDSTLALVPPPPPLTISVSAQRYLQRYRIRATIAATANPGDDLRLHMVIVEKEPIETPGIAGNPVYPWAMRDMVPAENGEAVTIANGDVVNVQHEVAWEPEWDENEVGVIVFVQNQSTRQVFQAGSTF